MRVPLINTGRSGHEDTGLYFQQAGNGGRRNKNRIPKTPREKRLYLGVVEAL